MSKLRKVLLALVYFSIMYHYSSHFFLILNHVVDVSQDLLQIRSYVYAEEPNIDIHNFIGTFTRVSAYINILLKFSGNSAFSLQNHCFLSLLIIMYICILSQLLQEDGDPPVSESLSIENTLWASTVVASGKYVTGSAALSMKQLMTRK